MTMMLLGASERRFDGRALRRAARWALAAALAVAAAPSHGQNSPWVQGLHSRVRLIAGGVDDGRHLAGVEIVLDKGFKTYWRHPGESGLPPQFDWTASDNAAAVELKWPAPARTEDAGGVAHTYAERVVFPVLVTPATAGKPVALALALDYGVCKDICIPVRAEVSLNLSGQADGRSAIEAALKRVPRIQPLADGREVSILSAAPVPGEKSRIAVTVRRPAGTAPALFVEAPDGWYLSAPARGEDTAPDTTRFVVTVDERPKDGAGPVPLRLTLVAGERAVETEASVALPSP